MSYLTSLLQRAIVSVWDTIAFEDEIPLGYGRVDNTVVTGYTNYAYFILAERSRERLTGGEIIDIGLEINVYGPQSLDFEAIQGKILAAFTKTELDLW